MPHEDEIRSQLRDIDDIQEKLEVSDADGAEIERRLREAQGELRRILQSKKKASTASGSSSEKG